MRITFDLSLIFFKVVNWFGWPTDQRTLLRVLIHII